MLKWSTTTTLDDAKTSSTADAVIFFDIKAASYMLKLSATAQKAGLYDYNQSVSL